MVKNLAVIIPPIKTQLLLPASHNFKIHYFRFQGMYPTNPKTYTGFQGFNSSLELTFFQFIFKKVLAKYV